MKLFRMVAGAIIPAGIVACFVIPYFLTAKAEPNSPIPPIVQAGLAVYASGGADPALSVWRKGGALDNEKSSEDHLDELKHWEKSIGHYKSYELIETKDIGTASKVFYLAMNFERGAVYASFVVYKTRKDWVVQSMDFDTKPEEILPWFARNGAK